MPARRLAVCSWSLRRPDPASLALAVRSLGLDAVQLALDPLRREAATWGDAAARLEAADVSIVSGMLAFEGEEYSTLETIARTGGVRPDAAWPARREQAAAAAAIAGRLGLSLVTFHAGFVPEEDGPARCALLDRLRVVADLFEPHGVALALETGQETAATLLEVLEALDRPSLGVNFDPANMILYGKGDPVDALAALAPHVRQVHVKDALPSATAGTWGRETPVGAGGVDWPRFLAEVGRLPRAVDLVIECEARQERLEDIRRAIAVVRGGADRPADSG